MLCCRPGESTAWDGRGGRLAAGSELLWTYMYVLVLVRVRSGAPLCAPSVAPDGPQVPDRDCTDCCCPFALLFWSGSREEEEGTLGRQSHDGSVVTFSPASLVAANLHASRPRSSPPPAKLRPPFSPVNKLCGFPFFKKPFPSPSLHPFLPFHNPSRFLLNPRKTSPPLHSFSGFTFLRIYTNLQLIFSNEFSCRYVVVVVALTCPAPCAAGVRITFA